jgi:hypothetical protein
MLDRRDFLRTSTLTVGALAMGPTFWSRALADEPVRVGPGPYGPLGAPNAAGVAVPANFTVRTVAMANQPVGPSPYVLPHFPDGSATFALPDGGWVLVVNSEMPGGQGGASAIEFAPDGAIRTGRRILGGSSGNCAGGATPWGTWLSCEEFDAGHVFECDPLGVKAAVRRDALGVFTHEAACVDPAGRRVYLTEDISDSGLYRFTPDAYPDLSRGVLEIATDGGAGLVVWKRLPDPSAATTPTRSQVPGTLRFKRGEGVFFDTGIVYVATTSDDRVYAYDTATERIEVLYDGKVLANAPLHQVDNLTSHAPSGDLFVAEDADDLQICVLTGDRVVAPFAQLSGGMHVGSEMTGVTFNPSGNRMYFSSQRAGAVPVMPGAPGAGGGMVFEVRGPFRTLAPRVTPVVSAMPAAPPTSGSQTGVGAQDGAAAAGTPGTGTGGGSGAGGGATRAPTFALRARPAARLATVRRSGLAVSVNVLAGTATVRLRAAAARSPSAGRGPRARAGCGSRSRRPKPPRRSRAAASRGRSCSPRARGGSRSRSC